MSVRYSDRSSARHSAGNGCARQETRDNRPETTDNRGSSDDERANAPLLRNGLFSNTRTPTQSVVTDQLELVGQLQTARARLAGVKP